MSNTLLLKYLDPILEEFIDKYLYYDTHNIGLNFNRFKEVFSILLRDLVLENQEDLEKHTIELAQLHIENQISYIVLLHQLNDIQNALVKLLIEHKLLDKIETLFDLYNKAQNIISIKYLDYYIKKTRSVNNKRLSSLNDMVQKELVDFYEDHLLWLDTLLTNVENLEQENFPELDEKLCSFGKWLYDEKSKMVVKNNSKHKNLIDIHKDLHDIAHLIKKQFLKTNPNYNILINYLEQCESISLGIGTELALIDNTIIIKKASKDHLTQALTRGSLENIFTNQYEIALATDTSFTLAMLDLDNFKSVNDNYGHVVGDQFLKAFVKIAMEILRKSDIIVRYGGEEFIIFLPNTNEDVSSQKLNEVREAFGAFVYENEGTKVQTTVSIGAIEIEPKVYIAKNQLDLNQYIKSADKYLYDAKKTGKNKVLFGKVQ